MQVQFDSNAALVTLSGEFTSNDHSAFKSMVTQLFESPASLFVIDLSKLDFIDSAGLGMLLLARDEATKANASLVLRGSHGQVKRMFGITKFDALFELRA